MPMHSHVSHFFIYFSNEVDSKLVGVGGMGEAFLDFDAFLTSILERLGSVLEGQDGSQIYQKLIKIEFPKLSVSASFFTSIFD